MSVVFQPGNSSVLSIHRRSPSKQWGPQCGTLECPGHGLALSLEILSRLQGVGGFVTEDSRAGVDVGTSPVSIP
jgi:hypothetical protein